MISRLTTVLCAAGVTLCVCVAAAGAAASVHAAAPADSRGETGARRIAICHRTGSVGNPFVRIVVDANSLSGHRGHAGDIVPAPAGGCPRRDDSCSQHGLPCESIPFAPSPAAALLAGIAGLIAAGWWIGRRSAA